MTTDATVALTEAHTEITVLFDRVRSPEEDRPAVLAEIMKTWACHVAVESEVLVPCVREQVAGGSELAEQLHHDHGRIEHLLTLLERRKANSPDVPQIVTEMLDLTEAHVAHADTELIPALTKSLSTEQLVQLGEELTNCRALQHHRYNAAPDIGPVAQMLRKVSETVNHLRDHSTDAGHAEK